MNIVFVTIPRSFKHPYLEPQLNAINSIKRYNANSEIILYSDDPGVYEFAKDNNCIAPKRVKKKDNLPLVNCALDFAKNLFPDGYICFINSDIMVMDNLAPVISYIESVDISKSCVLTAYRKEANVTKILSYFDMDELRANKSLIKGRHHALDVFILHSTLVSIIDMPDYRVGRVGWDSWIAGKVRRLGLRFLDASHVIKIIHQDHPQVHDKTGWDTLWDDWHSHGISNFGSLIDCNYTLKKSINGISMDFNFKQYLYGVFVGRMVRAIRRIILAFIREKVIRSKF